MILYGSAVCCCPVLLLKAIQQSLDVIFKTDLNFNEKNMDLCLCISSSSSPTT